MTLYLQAAALAVLALRMWAAILSASAAQPISATAATPAAAIAIIPCVLVTVASTRTT